MLETDPPQNLTDYLHSWLVDRHANTRLAFVFDPMVRLALGNTLAAGGRTWQVVRYDGNDLALRAAWRQAESRGSRRLIWVTNQDGASSPPQPLALSSLSDLLAKADDWVDMSMVGILDALIPNEVWPAAIVEEHGGLLSANLPALVTGYKKLRLLIGPRTALDAASIRILALHCSQPAIPVDDLLFHRDDAGTLLRHYIRLAWYTGWDAPSRELLRNHVRLSTVAPLGDVQPWLDTPIDELARYLYVRRFLSRNHVPQIANQIRGLGVLGFDPEPLETWVDQVLVRWEREPSWRQQVIASAEDSLALDDLARVAGLVTSPGAAIWAPLETVEGPGLFVQLVADILLHLKPEAVDAALRAWPTARPSVLSAMPETRHAAIAHAIAGFLDEAGRVVYVLGQGFQPGVDLAGIVDWYVAGGFYDLEYAQVRAADHVRNLLATHRTLATALTDYLAELRSELRDFLRHADLELADRIRGSWQQYLSSPRLATNVLSDLIKRRRMRPTPEQCLWFVVFDGMRWDTWQQVVKPRLLEQFEFTEPEKAYLSMLPSWTMVARTSLLTGQPPKYWQRRNDRQSVDQRALAARALDIPANNVDRTLRFFSNMEADRQYLQLNPDERFPWNILIFNISDDNLHKEKGSLSALNGAISVQLDSIMQTLALVVRPDDTLLISSDHGFIELDDEDGVIIRDEARWQRQTAGSADPVRYRYLLGMKSNEGYAFDLPGFSPPEFTVAISQTWFKRSDDRRRPDRYAHGGLSFGEMVVPGALLRRIVEKKVEIVLEHAPTQVQVHEGEPLLLEVAIHNRGNQTGACRLEIRWNTDALAQPRIETLAPGERKVLQVRLAPITKIKGGVPTYIELLFSTQDLQEAWLTPRRQDIQLQIEERKDIVEIQFAGLDALDDL
jgi:hypothetical protein